MFILVFSLDNRDSFEEVQRLKRQILDTKSCLKNKTKENVDVPLVICGNKGDRDFYREVEQREIEQLVGADPQRCAYFEISAKRNSRLDQMFHALFAMANLPREMSPDLHRRVSAQHCEALHKKALRGKRLRRAGGDQDDAFGILAPWARRPSVHSDLMYTSARRPAAAARPRTRNAALSARNSRPARTQSLRRPSCPRVKCPGRASRAACARARTGVFLPSTPACSLGRLKETEKGPLSAPEGKRAS